MFRIKTRFEAYAVIYALAVGATTRGYHYLSDYPGLGGYFLFIACMIAVLMAGATLLDATPRRWRGEERRRGQREDRRSATASG